MRTRRRRQKFTWLPNSGSSAVITEDQPFSQLVANLTIPPDGGLVTAISIVTHDTPQEGDSLGANVALSTILGNEYIVKRIVGRCFLSAQAPADDPPTTVFPKTLLIGVGFFVARANDEQSGGGNQQPIGSASAAEARDNYNPLSLDTTREPWMWQRTYILSTGRADNSDPSLPVPFSDFFSLTTNTWMSGLMSPHFDIKSARRVRQDERLFFAIGARTLDNEWPTNHVPNQVLTSGVALVLDYRILGALRKAYNRSNF